MRKLFPSLPNKRWLFSQGLMGAGCAILLVVCLLYVGARYKEWLVLQPRRAQTNQLISIATPRLTPTPMPSSTPTPPSTPTPIPIPVALPPVRIEIPSIGVSRSVIPVELVSHPTTGEPVWDVESLFATTGRSDLVGHLESSVYPGMHGNIVLTGHNYNRGRYNWTGVFYNLGRLKIGDQVILIDAQDSQFIYVVEQITLVPWRSKSDEELSQHMVFLGDTLEETLTLVTCGGANIGPFPERLYVVAKPAQRIVR